MSSTRPGNQNRGWNDPPEILHSATENANLVLNSQRNILNKRVAHNFTDSKPVDRDPNSPTVTQTVSNATLAVPPTTTSDQLVEEQLQVIDSTSNQSDETEFSSELSLEFIEKVFSEKLDYIKSKSIANKTVDDLAKRIKIFSNSWSKLSLTVKENMLKLAQGKKRNTYSQRSFQLKNL
jgi:hypothetical protein